MVVCVKEPEVYVVEVFAIVVHDEKGLTELSQRTTEPVCPDNVKVPLVEPSQIVVPPVTEPPTEAGSTVTVVSVEFASEQTPL